MALGLEQAIAVLLNENSFGDLYDGTTPKIFVGEEPETPDATITVLNSGGARGELDLGERHQIQIRVRDPSYAVAMSTLRDIHDLLHEYQGQPSGVPVIRIESLSPGVSLGRDAGASGGRVRSTEVYAVHTRHYDFF